MSVPARCRIALGVTLILVCLSSAGALAQQYEPDHLVVEMKEGYGIDLVNAQFGTTTAQHLQLLDVYLLNVPAGSDLVTLADEIKALPEVKDCHPNFFVDPMQAVQGSLPISDDVTRNDYLTQPATRLLDLDAVHALTTGAGVKVAVVDGGVDYNQPSLSGHVISGWDYVDNDSDAFDEPGGANHGHGTFIAGIIHLVAPDAQIVAYRVTDTAGNADGYLVAEAIMQAIADGCRVINISMVMYGRHAAISSAIWYGHEHGCVTVVASGNGGDSIPRYPASDGGAIAVAALDSNDVIADFSCYGSHIDVCAPGADVYSSYVDSLYARWSGSSFAAPFAAGEAALLTAYKPYFTGFHVTTGIVRTGSNVDAENPGYAGLLGSGLIDPMASFDFDPVVCGDVDGSGRIDAGDLTALIFYVSGQDACSNQDDTTPLISPASLEAADINADPGIDAGDVAFMFGSLFGNSAAPCTVADPAVPVSEGSVALASVEGASGHAELAINQPITFYLRVDNSSDEALHVLSNGFSLHSPEGATWDSCTIQTDDSAIHLDAGQAYISLAADDSGLTTLYPAGCPISDPEHFGMMSASGPGVPGGTSGVLYRISIGAFGPEDVGKTLILDSASFGNGGLWSWYGTGDTPMIPSWGGPYAFTIIQPQYLPGDVNNSGMVNVSDLTWMVEYLFEGGPPPPILAACDVNGDCSIMDVSDLTYLVDCLFRGGASPVYSCSRVDLW